MRSRWLLNLFLLLLVAGIALFLYLRPEKVEVGPTQYPVSTASPADVSRISIEFPAKAPVVLEKRDGNWIMTKPYQVRASKPLAGQILSILHATSANKFPTDDLARFGLDHPVLRLKLDDVEIAFGTINPVSNEQYIVSQNAVYLVATSFSEVASTQVLEMFDKSPLAPQEKIAGFDFSRLEQWEKTGLRVERGEDGLWQVSAKPAKPDQKQLNQWFDDYWANLEATSVEFYKPDRHETYPSFEVKLKDGKRVHFDKLQESPELLLARPDEGLLYHFPQDAGFVILNPPVGFKPE